MTPSRWIVLISCMPVFLFGGLVIEDEPSTIIQGEYSELGHPEGVTFSPSGDCLAVANFFTYSITIYNRIGDSGSQYETTPCCVIQGPDCLINRAHDLAFSPDGQHIAVANRKNHSVTIYQKEGNTFQTEPFCVISGPQAQLNEPSTIAYSPIDNFLAVGNGLSNSINFYRYEGNEYSDEPFWIISNTTPELAVPDGLAFSADGQFLAASGHENHSAVVFKLLPNSTFDYDTKAVSVIEGTEALLCYSHSVSFHPSGDYLAISSAGGRNSVNIYEKASKLQDHFNASPFFTLQTFNPKTIYYQKRYPEEGGAKGLSFSPDGKSLAICASDIIHHDRRILIYAVHETDD